MKTVKTKKYFYTLLAALIIISAVSAWEYVLADNESESDSEDGGQVTSVINTSPAKNTAQKTETVTEYKKLSDTITQVITTITRHDSDGDGLYDDEDPHPTINEYFIVKDDNSNGIDDQYEQ